MGIEILNGDKEGIDFSEPIIVDEKQKESIINYFKKNYKAVEVISVNEFRTDRLGVKEFKREWSELELELLLKMDLDTGNVAELLGRTWMSVDIKRGQFVSDFIGWSYKQGYPDLLKIPNIKSLIKKFLKEKEDLIKEKRSKRSNYTKQINELKKEIEINQDILSELKTNDFRSKVNFLIEMKMPYYNKYKDIDSYIKIKTKETKEKLLKLNSELNNLIDEKERI